MNRTETAVAPSSARDAWWKKTIVRRAAHFVERDVAHVQRHAPFLQQQLQQRQGTSNIALFDRSEIVTGRVLGQGGFSIVLAVEEIVLDPAVDARITASQRAARLACREAVRTGQASYALKHLHADKVLMAPKSSASSAGPSTITQQQQQYAAECSTHFCHAAADLAVEAAYMSALDDHPNIVACRGLPVQGISAWNSGAHDAFFILMDAVVETLDYRIQQVWSKQKQNNQGSSNCGDAPLQEKLQHAMELARALEYLHARRIVFRDLKPHNIGFTAANQVKLFDFGLCRELPIRYTTSLNTTEGELEETYEMSGVGTRRYMAVEIINTSMYNCKADVYSWAMVVWEMLSLEKPFKKYSTEDHRLYVCQGGERPDCNTYKLPKALCNLLQQAWCEELQERVSIKEALSLLTAIYKAQQYMDIPDSPHGVVDGDDMLLDYVPPCKERIAFFELPPCLLRSLTTVTGTEEENEMFGSGNELFLSMNDCSIMSEASDIDSLSNFSLLDFTMTLPEGVEVIAASSMETRDEDRAAHCVTPPLREITLFSNVRT